MLIGWHVQGTPDPERHGVLMATDNMGREILCHQQTFEYTTCVEARRKAKRLSLIKGADGDHWFSRVSVWHDQDCFWTSDDYYTAKTLQEAPYLLKRLRAVYEKGEDILPCLVKEAGIQGA